MAQSPLVMVGSSDEPAIEWQRMAAKSLADRMRVLPLKPADDGAAPMLDMDRLERDRADAVRFLDAFASGSIGKTQ